MRWVVVRNDWTIVVTNTSRKNAEALLKKYMRMKPRTRAKWLEQWGVVMHFPYYFTFDESLVGVYTPEEFLSKYRQFYDKFIAKANEEIARAKNKYEAAAWKRKITLFRKWFQWVESYLPTAIITRTKIERKKRIEPVARFSKIDAVYAVTTLRRYAEYSLNEDNVGIAEFKNTVWVFLERGDFMYTLIVHKDASEEDIANAVQSIIEYWKYEIENVQYFMDKVSGFSCEEAASNKGELAWCREVYGKASTALAMLKLLVAGGDE